MKKAIYPGSFDPPTLGHLDIIKRSAEIFENVTVLVMSNSQKKPLFSPLERVSMIKEFTSSIPGVSVETYEGLLVDYAKETQSDILIRGLRATMDFEYELQISQVNRVQYPRLETVFLATSLEYAYLSSTVVREFASYGGDISKFVPPEIISLICDKYQKDKE